MKFLKFILVLVLLVLFLLLGGVIFSNNIISFMTKTKNSEFQNVKFSLKNREMTFDNFVINGNNLGRGRATVIPTRSGLFKMIPSVKLSNLKLEQVNLDKIYKEKDEKIDNFIEKLEIPESSQKENKTTDEFVRETTLNTKVLANDIDNFINNKIKEDIIKTNTLKNDYSTSKDLKNKAQKIVDLNSELNPLVKSINEEKENAEKSLSKIEDERNLMLQNVSTELTKLEKEISMNDVNKMNNNNIQNMNLYIFMDKGKVIGNTLSKSLKVVKLIKEIENLKISISNVNINNGEVVVNDLKNPQNLNGYISQNNLKALINKKNEDYQIAYRENDLSMRILYSDKKINTVIEYLKNNLISGKIIKLVSEVVLENNNFKNLNNTILTDEEKQLLLQKMESLKVNDYNQLMAKYAEQTRVIENLIENVNIKVNKLDTLKKDLLSLDKIVVLEQPQTNEQNKNSTLPNSLNENSQTNGQNEKSN
ncbi:hypothetical protein [Leptotrichia sp. oral taxon 847]|uniref:hypothetical protein n=1 Tax=Leptotrichia sp. oral taxon 847 TaxID=1785996 RepID=UPI000767E491|nr:hypothetical protein [Leptotrichia sp. oral taxon 847]AMD95173.1 hypothetical protein AXF11_06010 [Leptotrichia sp. oral taxon 847]